MPQKLQSPALMRMGNRPFQRVRVKKGHPLSAGLCRCYRYAANGLYDVVSSKKLANTSGEPKINSAGQLSLNKDNFDELSFDESLVLAEATVASCFKIQVNDNQYCNIVASHNHGTANKDIPTGIAILVDDWKRCYVQNAYRSGNAGAPKLSEIILYDTLYRAIATTSQVTGSVVNTLEIDGVAATGTYFDYWAVNAGICNNGLYADNSDKGRYTGTQDATDIWERALSKAERKMWSDNPNCFLEVY